MTKKRLWPAIVVFTFFLSFLLLFSQAALQGIYPRKYSHTVEYYSSKYDIPPEIVYAVIKTESNFNPVAVSSAGAVGLMQIMPSTFEWLCVLMNEKHDVSALYDPEINIRFGVFYLRYLYDYYGSYETAFAAYNAGMGNVSKWLASEEYSPGGKLTHIPFSETDSYVRAVNRRAEQYQKLYKMKG